MGIRGRVGRLGVGVCLAIGLLGAGAASAQQQTLDFQLLAGGRTGDGGQAKDANLHGVGDIVMDRAGNLYVSQYWDNRIRKITPDGVITTVVGGRTGNFGDGGPASQALINHPAGMVFDGYGNLYFADAGNRMIRRISPAGIITRFIGIGEQPYGLAIDNAANFYVSDRTGHRVYKITYGGTITPWAGTGVAGNSGNGGPATAAMLNTPSGIDADSAGNLYIADTQNSVVRRVSPDGTITEHVSGLLFPENVKVDGLKNLWIGNSDCTLQRVAPNGASMYWGNASCERSPDGTPAATAGFGVPDGVAFDSANRVYFADTDFARVARMSSTYGGTISTFAGGIPDIADGSDPLSAALTLLTGVSVGDDGDVVFTDALFARRVRKLSDGKLSTIAGNGGFDGCIAPCPAMDTGFSLASAVVHAPGGVLFVADRANNRVLRITPDGVATRYAGGLITSAPNLGDGGDATRAAIDPYGLALDSAGNLFIADFQHHRIRKVAPDGIITTYAGNGTAGFGGDNGPASAAMLNQPYGLSIDHADSLYIADYGNNRVRKITAQGVISTIAGRGCAIYFISGHDALEDCVAHPVSVASYFGNVYISTNGVIARITTGGIIQRVDGFPNYPYALAVKNGGLYVTSDSGRLLRAALPRRATKHDYDGDGTSDLFWRSTVGGNAIWKSANSATQQDTASRSSDETLVAEGDFDGDLKTDVMWRNANTGTNLIWLGGVATNYLKVIGASSAWSVAGVGDFDNDGRSDLLWRSTSGGNGIWTGAQYDWQNPVAALDVNWKVAGVADFDGDGRSDIFWRNPVTGGNQIWLSANAATKKPIINVGLAWKVAGVGDFDHDGRDDILWRSASGSNAIWKSANNTTQQGVVGVSNPDWNVASVGDYDADGFADILWRNNATGENAIWPAADYARRKSVPAVSADWRVVPAQP